MGSEAKVDRSIPIGDGVMVTFMVSSISARLVLTSAIFMQL